MAGKGTRFSEYGFKTPKFLLPINDRKETMIHSAVDTLNAKCFQSTYTFIIQSTSLTDDLKREMKEYNPNWVVLNEVTDGPATTVMLSMDKVPDNVPLLISNSDQILSNWNCQRFINLCSKYDGGVLTYTPPYPVEIGTQDKHSFVQIDEKGNCTMFAEKLVLSKQALIGVHYFRNKQTFIDAYKNMIETNERAPNGEFYMSLLYNALIRQKKTITYVPLQDNEQFFPTGEPKDYFHYLNTVSHFGPKPFMNKGDAVIIDNPILQVSLVRNGVGGCRGPGCYHITEDDTITCSSIVPGNCIQIILKLSDKSYVSKTTVQNFVRGWIIGDFTPSLHQLKEFEIGILRHKSGEKWPYHIHEEQTEYNYLLKGCMVVNGLEYSSGDNFMFEKGHPAVPIFIEDCTVLCIKFPSLPKDKKII